MVKTLTILISLFCAPAVWAQTKAYELKLVPENVHWGYFDARVKPVLKINSGDTVRVETMIARGVDRLTLAGVPDSEIPESLKIVDRTIKDRLGPHPLTGPIFVESAEPGDALEVKFIGFEFLHPYGVGNFFPSLGTLPDDFPYVKSKLVRFDPKSGEAQFLPGIGLKLAPFFGTVGVALPAIFGRTNSMIPGPYTGNIDNKELVAGSSLYLPVHVTGGLLSMGDGHAMQGDGEVSVAALETSLRGTIQVILHKGMHLKWPRAETPTHYITMGLDPDLDEAAKLATREMIDFLVTEKGIPRDEAYILCSLAADLRVTQLVDSTKGVHAMIAKSIFK
jgi:acetamidase/formamidase